MLITEKSDVAQFVKILDINGEQIKKVISIDTETLDAEVYASLSSGRAATDWNDKEARSLFVKDGKGGRHIVKFKCNLQGCKVIDVRTGKEIK